MSAKEKLKSYLLGKTEESPPENLGVDGTLIREVLDAKQTEILGAVTGALDERLAEFKPMLESFKAKKEEDELLAKLNESRKARGLKPVVAEEDDDDGEENEKKEAPGRHDKKYKAKAKKSEDDDDDDKNPFKKDNGDDKDALRIQEIVRAEISRASGLKGESTALNVDASASSGNKLKLPSTGRVVPFGDDWEFALNGSIGLRQALQSDKDATIDEINDFDVAVANLKHKLRSNGINPPVNSSRANGTVTHHFA